MSRLMTILGIVFLALGAAIAVVGLARPGQMQVSGLTMDSAALLLMTGLIGLGFGGVIEALQGRSPAVAVKVSEVAGAPVVETKVEELAPVAVEQAPAAAPAEEQPSRIRFRGFGRKQGVEAAAVAATVAVAEAVVEPAKSNVDDTIDALEQAKHDIASALGGVERISATPPPTMSVSEPEPQIEDVEAAESDEAADEEGELYVVEEKVIRGRPARILSDDTVEAETDEGWMRFENLDHLNEYLDAAEA